MRGFLMTATALAMLGGALPARANLLVNGDFELPVVAAGSFSLFNVGATGLTGWTVFGPAGHRVVQVETTYTEPGIAYPAQSGSAWLDLMGDTVSGVGVSQTVNTTIGNTYELSFYIANNTRGGSFGTSSTVHTALDGTQTWSDTSTAGTSSVQGWQGFVHSFVATGTTTTLSFVSADPTGDFVDGIDNMVLLDLGVVAAPEPTSLLILATGLAGLTLNRRRQRSAKD